MGFLTFLLAHLCIITCRFIYNAKIQNSENIETSARDITDFGLAMFGPLGVLLADKMRQEKIGRKESDQNEQK